MRRIFVLAAVAVAGAANAYTIDTYPFWDGNVTSGWFKIAQSFVVDNTDNVMVNYKFAMDGGTGNINLSIVPWDDSVGETGGAVFSQNLPWPASTGDVSVGMNLALTPGAKYAAVVDLLGSASSSVHWMANNTGNPTGNSNWWNNGWSFPNSGWSTEFRADFRSVPEPATFFVLGSALLALRARRKR